jgi:hypothetical protein
VPIQAQAAIGRADRNKNAAQANAGLGCLVGCVSLPL